MSRAEACLYATWHTHPPAHVMRYWQHQLAALVWACSGGMGWEVEVRAGAGPGNVPQVGVAIVLGDAAYVQVRAAELVLETVRAEVER